MAAIKLDPNGKKLTAEIASGSPHVVGVDLTVFDMNGNQTEKCQGAITDKSNTIDFPLKNAPAAYDGFQIQATCDFKSPNGDDAAPVKATYQLLEDGQVVQPTISITGNTEGGTFKDTEIFDVTAK
ncbi:MAG TPA: hypothetical protein VGR89_08820 [Puia sp.]|nr:hypothetical protein [Puia sp.]